MLISRLLHLRRLITAETPAYGPGKHYLPTREPGPLFFSEKQRERADLLNWPEGEYQPFVNGNSKVFVDALKGHR
jgi:hypothetical protein